MPVLACLKIQNKAFTPNTNKINPPVISRNFDGSFLKKFPSQKPDNDIKTEPIPMINAEYSIGVFVKCKFTPAPRASILVAIPIPIRHFNPIQQIVSCFS